MRYAKGHKDATRRKLLDSSRALVKKGGFDSTGVDALMAAVGLTAGAFYSHFPSKQALLEEVVREEMAHSLAMLMAAPDDAPEHTLRNLHRYLSDAHAKRPDAGCVLPALGAELGRSEAGVRAIVEQGLATLHENWQARLGDGDAAWSLMAQCVGALVLARSVKTQRARSEILEANRHTVERLLGA